MSFLTLKCLKMEFVVFVEAFIFHIIKENYWILSLYTEASFLDIFLERLLPQNNNQIWECY